MKIKRIVPIGISCSLVLGGISYAWAVENDLLNNSTTGSPAINETKLQEVKIETKKIESKDEFLEINIKLPVIKGLSNTVYQTQLNNTIMENATKQKAELEKESKEYFEECKKQGWEARPYQLYIDFDVKSNGDILSFTILNYSYTGGANGISAVDYYNINVKENKKLELNDLFKKNSKYIDIINQEIKDQINYQETFENKLYFHKDGEASKELDFKTITKDQNFYMQDGNLVVCFPKYEIAPGYMGEPEFRIPFKNLESVLEDTSLADTSVLYEEKISQQNELVNINMKIPVLRGLKDAVYQEQLNYFINNHAMKQKAEVEKAAKEFSEEAKKQGWEMRPYQLTTDYSIKSTGNILSFMVKSYQYTGGANGILTTHCYNIDMNNGENIALNDLFKENADYKKIINDELKVQIKDMKEQGKVFFDGESGFTSITDTQSFYIEGNDIVIHFGLYEIAPRSEGEVEFRIPMDKLQEYLK